MKKFTKYFVLALFGFGLTSCLEDENVEEQRYGMINLDANKIIELPTATRSLALDYSATPVIIDYATVHLAASEPAEEDIQVTLVLDPTKVPSTNVVLPTSMYTLPSGLVVTIPKGSRDGILKLSVNPSELDASKVYALGLSIASVDKPGYIISGNYNSLVSRVNAKNTYDGIYASVAGNVQRYTNPTTPTTDALNGSMAGNPDVQLVTINANTVEIVNLNWARGGGGIGGIDNLRATVDPATNQVTMSALGNATLSNIAGAVNMYDPATKTFTLNFAWNPTGAKREVTGLVLTYNKSR